MATVFLILGILGHPQEGTFTAAVPPIYVSIVSHNEEPSPNGYPDFTVDTAAFWRHRTAVLAFAEMLHQEGVKYNYQSDWNFLLAATLFDTGTTSTNGKNFLKYLEEDLGFEVDPHAHETQYNYADVAYLMHQLLGHEPSHTVGGYLACPPENSQIEYFRDTLYGWHYPYAWKAEILWGGSFPGHVGDDSLWTSGIWKPKDNAHYLVHDEYAPLPEVGGYARTWQGLWDLLEKQENGELVPGRMYTATLFLEQSMMLDSAFIDTFRNRIRALSAYTDSGRIVWVTLQEAVQIWQTQYDSRPNLYSYLYGDITEPIRDTFWFPMNDGVHLDVTLFRPVDAPPPGGFPAIVFVHGLGGSKYQMEPRARYYAEKGYVTLAYSVRGQGNSEGLSTLFGWREQADLESLITWLAARPDVNDTLIGVAGASQGGFHSWLAAVRQMGVRAVAPENSTPQISLALVRNGCYRRAVTVGIHSSPAVRFDTVAYPIKQLLLADDYDSIRALIADGRDFDSTDIAASDAHFAIQGAWQDHLFWTNLLPSAFRNTPRRSVLYLGTNGHGSPSSPMEQVYRNALQEAFFAATLQGDSSALDTFPSVTVSLGPFWQHRAYDTWPPPQLSWMPLYFHPSGWMYVVPWVYPDTVAHLSNQRVDPSYTWEAAVLDEFRHVPDAFLMTRRTWRTEPLQDTVIVCGAPIAQVYAKSTAERFQINLQLYDEPPSGPPVFLTQVSLGVRENPDTTAWLLLEGEFNAIAWIIPPGHRIRVDWVAINLTPSDTFLWTLPYWADGIHSFGQDSRWPSRVLLPVLTLLPQVEERGLPRQGSARVRVLPNPAHGSVKFQILGDYGQEVLLTLFDPTGRKLREWRIQPGHTKPLIVTWDGRDNDYHPVPSGVYLLRLTQPKGNPHAERFIYLR